MTCCICLYVREEPRDADTVLGGYAVCRNHVSVIGAVVGRDWVSILVIAGLPAREAQRNPRPPMIWAES